jgi:hypothetical protein
MNSDLFKRFALGLIFSIFAVIFLQNTFTAEKTFAQTDSTPWASKIQHKGVPFGGLITGKVKCTCEPPKYMIFIWDFTSKSLITLKVDEPKSKLWEVFRLDVNQYALGTYDPKEICKIKTGSGCFNYPVTGVINSGPGVGSSGFMGTSATGQQIIKNTP